MFRVTFDAIRRMIYSIFVLDISSSHEVEKLQLAKLHYSPSHASRSLELFRINTSTVCCCFFEFRRNIVKRYYSFVTRDVREKYHENYIEISEGMVFNKTVSLK